MKAIIILLLIALMKTAGLQAQVYKVTTSQTDSFAVALVKLLNCAAGGFTDCTGDSIRSTWLMGNDHKLAFSFPGCAVAIVRVRDWNRNAYIEFRGFDGKKSRDLGIKELVEKIKKALGEQFYDAHQFREDKTVYFYGLSVKDAGGYFAMNIELFGGSSSAPVYLLGPEKEGDSLPKKDFVLLKIYSGIPAYNYFIQTVATPDTALDAVLRQLVLHAKTDFEKIPVKKTDSLFYKRKGMDTLHINDLDVLLNYRGGNYSASLQFAAASDSVTLGRQWKYYQQVLQAALGSGYVYHLYGSGQREVVYFSRAYSENMPRIYLAQEKQSNNSQFIQIKIQSIFTHPTKRGLNLDD